MLDQRTIRVYDNYIKRMHKLTMQYNVKHWKEYDKVQTLYNLTDELREAIITYSECRTGHCKWSVFTEDMKTLLVSNGLKIDHEFSWEDEYFKK